MAAIARLNVPFFVTEKVAALLAALLMQSELEMQPHHRDVRQKIFVTEKHFFRSHKNIVRTSAQSIIAGHHTDTATPLASNSVALSSAATSMENPASCISSMENPAL